ncbi:MAG: VIT1/CCC1 family predicted Fe2+/Mn2+ transporter [Maribacter sp.]|jgi:VIT1/CCC1 family predicted Fe2+/Mn2+ transporter
MEKDKEIAAIDMFLMFFVLIFSGLIIGNYLGLFPMQLMLKGLVMGYLLIVLPYFIWKYY